MKVSDIKIERISSTLKKNHYPIIIYLIGNTIFLFLVNWCLYSNIKELGIIVDIVAGLILSILFSIVYGLLYLNLGYHKKVELYFKKKEIQHSFIHNTLNLMPFNQPIRFSEFTDRIGTTLIANGKMDKSQYPQLKTFLKEIFIQVSFKKVILELFKSNKLIKDNCLIIVDEKDYWSTANKMIELGITPIKTVISDNIGINDPMILGIHQSKEHIIFLENEGDFNLFNLSATDKNFLAINTTQILNTIDKVLNDEVDVWQIDNYGRCFIVDELNFFAKANINSWAPITVTNVVGQGAVSSIPYPANMPSQNINAINVSSKKGP